MKTLLIPPAAIAVDCTMLFSRGPNFPLSNGTCFRNSGVDFRSVYPKIDFSFLWSVHICIGNIQYEEKKHTAKRFADAVQPDFRPK